MVKSYSVDSNSKYVQESVGNSEIYVEIERPNFIFGSMLTSVWLNLSSLNWWNYQKSEQLVQFIAVQ